MSDLNLSYNTLKALRVHIGEAAGAEVADLLRTLAERIDHLEKNKVSMIPIVPGTNQLNQPHGSNEFPG